MSREIRQLSQSDNEIYARIIRSCFEEFDAIKPGTVYFDPTTDHLFEYFEANPKSSCYVALLDGLIVGGCGIFPIENIEDTCELVKFYLTPSARGMGVGKELMLTCFETAKQLGYTKIYLETLPELTLAVPLYEKMGFVHLIAPLGNSGHWGCNIWMLKDLTS